MGPARINRLDWACYNLIEITAWVWLKLSREPLWWPARAGDARAEGVAGRHLVGLPLHVPRGRAGGGQAAVIWAGIASPASPGEAEARNGG
jgi:hypothetical protein